MRVVKLNMITFKQDLESCLTIIAEPTKSDPFYICEYISPGLYKEIIKIEILK